MSDALLIPANSALVVIDYQPSQMRAVRSMDQDLLSRNIVSVARLAKAFRLPIVLSTVNVVANGASPTPRAQGGPRRPPGAGPDPDQRLGGRRVG